MKKLTFLFAFALVSLFSVNTLRAQQSIAMGSPIVDHQDSVVLSTKTIGEVTLSGAEVCKKIEAHAPVETGSTFSKDVGKVWVYSKLTMDKTVTSKVKHVYFFKGKKISEVELDVRGPGFRTNSYKTITKYMLGDWKVEIQAANGEVFETLSFTITD